VRKGRRLGMLLDGWFFDSGVDLERTLTAGWHHLAVSASRGKTSFHADGNKLGSVKTVQPALRLNGSSDYVEVPAHASPTTAITVSVWARSATATWNQSGCLVSKRSAFIMHPNQGSRTIRFYVWIDTNEQFVEYTPDDIQGWHLYTGTFDGNYVRLYIDGAFAAERAVTGTIQASSGTMTIGLDSGNWYFKGDIAEVSYWNTARGSSEVREDVFRSFKGDEPGLIGYWRMSMQDKGGTRTIEDLTANARHGTVKGTPQDVTITTQRDMPLGVLGNASGGGCPIGRLAEVRMWNLGLSDAEVAAHARTAITGNEPGLIAFWPLDEATGATANDRSAGGVAHGTMSGVDWVGRTANLGNPGSKVLALPESGGAHVQCPAVELAGKSFTFECWARRSGPRIGSAQLIATTSTLGFTLMFYPDSTLWVRFKSSTDVIKTTASYADTDWHHWCATHDQSSNVQRLYRDGELIGERTATADNATGTGALYIGGSPGASGSFFIGELAEVRVWDRARSQAEIRGAMRRRLSGTEDNLIAYYPLDELSSDNKARDQKAGQFTGQLKGSARLLSTTALPMMSADNLVVAEYSSVEVSGEGKKQALMRRFHGYAAGGDVALLPEQRVEELSLQWIGNTQISPTLLGYIEGAPPVPSENLTLQEDYDGATSVVLKQSHETSYTWKRNETQSSAFSLEGFVGASWDISVGVGIEKKAIEGEVGGKFNYAYDKTHTKDSAVSASSSLATTDSLALLGMIEDKASCAAVGKRWIPKNVGYALVISGMADVFVTKLKRSGRMVSYDIRPVEGVPLDVNTITFLINPAYTLNGSLDGQVGSASADATFYPHVPGMRAQYGSLYPASYFRLKEAYALKHMIERQDKARESFFYNFDASQIDQLDSLIIEQGAPGGLPEDGTQGSANATDKDIDAMKAQNEKKKKELQEEAKKRQEEIKKRQSSLEGRVRANAAFADWQLRMENIQTRAGKRNIVNTYVWDGDGGLRVEEQSFASTIEHSMNTEIGHSGGGGASADVGVAAFKFALSAVGSGGKKDGSGKTLALTKSLELNVDVAALERNGITDARDNPLVPGEKVDRYRFMSFYLEGSTDHFADFFSYVVDPEWLMSNDEEARALRQTHAAKPNKCWRVLHRVTYVERPALMGFGRNTRPLADADRATREIVSYFNELKAKHEDVIKRLTAINVAVNKP
jgi:hypothetical protein